MADNIAVTPGTGATIAADDVSAVLFQKIKVDGGGDGVSVPMVAGRVADAAAFPVALTTEVHAKLDLLATAAKQPGLGTAGTANSNVISVQGIASMTPVQTSSIAGQVGIAGGAGAASALTTRVVIVTDQTAIPAKTTGYKTEVAITRPSDTTAYAAGDVIGDTGGSAIFTFANMGPSSSYLRLNGGRLFYNLAALISGMGGWRVHLYNASPTAIADNAAFNLVSGDRAKYLGYIDIGALQDFGDTLFTEANQQNKQILLAGGTTIYAQLQTLTAFTPSSADTLTLVLMGEDL